MLLIGVDRNKMSAVQAGTNGICKPDRFFKTNLSQIIAGVNVRTKAGHIQWAWRLNNNMKWLVLFQ